MTEKERSDKLQIEFGKLLEEIKKKREMNERRKVVVNKYFDSLAEEDIEEFEKKLRESNKFIIDYIDDGLEEFLKENKEFILTEEFDGNDYEDDSRFIKRDEELKKENEEQTKKIDELFKQYKIGEKRG